MAKLGDVLAAIIEQIGHARAQADLISINVAQLYRDHPLLAEFPVPRFELSEVTVDLRIAIEGVRTSSKAFSPESKAALVEKIGTYVDDLPASGRMSQVIRLYPALADRWAATRDTLLATLAEKVPVTTDVDALLLGSLMASLLQRHVDVVVRAVITSGIGPAPQDVAVIATIAGEAFALIENVLQKGPAFRALTPEGREVVAIYVDGYLDTVPGLDWAEPFFRTAAAVDLWDLHRDNLYYTMLCAVPAYSRLSADVAGSVLANIMGDHMRAILLKVRNDEDVEEEVNTVKGALRTTVEDTLYALLPDGEVLTGDHADELWNRIVLTLDAIEVDSALAHYFTRFESLSGSWNAEREGAVKDEAVAFVIDNGDQRKSYIADGIASIIVEALTEQIDDLLDGELDEFGVPEDVPAIFTDYLDAVLNAHPAAPDLAPEGRASLVEGLNGYAQKLPGSRSAETIGLAAPAVAAAWEAQLPRVEIALAAIVPVDRISDRKKLSEGVAAVIACNISVARAEATSTAILIPDVQQEAQAFFQKTIIDTLRDNSPTTTGIDVQVTAGELSAVPADHITTMRLQLREQDMSWSRSADSNGVIHSHLAP